MKTMQFMAASLALAATAAFATPEGWTDDFDAAKAQAAKEAIEDIKARAPKSAMEDLDDCLGTLARLEEQLNEKDDEKKEDK